MPISYTWPLIGSGGTFVPLPSTLSSVPNTASSVPVVRDLAIDVSTGDVVIAQNDIAVVSDITSIVQDVKLSLQMVEGEWFLDNTAGLPWYTGILGKGSDLAFIRAAIQSAIEARVGINQVTSLNAKLDNATRTLAVVFSASSDLGELRALLLPLSVNA